MSFLSDIFGSKPQIADYTPVDLQQEQLTALQGDIAAWPDIANLGNLFQQYMLNQYETAIPGFRDILKMGGQTTKDMLTQADQELKGQIPQDVMEQVQRSSAYQSLLSGTAGSGMARGLTARDLGLTSLDLIGQGAQLAGQAGNAAQRWAALSGAQMPEGMLVTPQQQAALDMQQNLIERNIQQQKFNVAAAPDPALQALNQWVEQVGGSIVASYAGGGMGGKGNYATSYNPSSYGAGDISQGIGATGSPMYGTNAPAYAPVQFNDPGQTNTGYLSGGSSIPGYGYDFTGSPINTGSSDWINNLNTQGFYSGAFGG